MPEVEVEHKGLRLRQRQDIIREEFKKSEDNPFNQTNAAYDATRDELAGLKQKEREKVEGRLGGN
jgi:Coiled-coil domain-containing protein 124 /Oxs1